MGIENLLNFIKPALLERSIVDFRGKTAAIDAMSWLYRGCYSCAVDLNQNIETHDFLYFIQKMLTMLREYNVKPYMVFDGRKLRAKEKTEQLRKQLKQQNLQKAQELKSQGNENDARKYFQRSLKITKRMLYVTLDFLQELQIQYIVAPYEADAQMAHLCLTGVCDFAITEDSDLICYFCPWIVFKLQSDGSCLELQLEKLMESTENRRYIENDDVRVFFSFQREQIVDVCIMSGCDYTPSIRGVGIRKAVELMYQVKQTNYVVSKLRSNKAYRDKVPKDYEKLVKSIRMIFQYQTIYDPIQKRQIQLNQIQYDDYLAKLEDYKLHPQAYEDPVFEVSSLDELVGKHFPAEKQVLFSQGDLDFKTLELREKPKLDFIQLFKKNEKRIQIQPLVDNRTTIENIRIIKELGISQPFVQQESFGNLIQEPVFLEVRKTKEQPAPIDVFKLCDEIFGAELLQEQEEEQQENERNEVGSEEEFENPFAVKQSQSVIKQQLSDLKSDDVKNSLDIKKPGLHTVQKEFLLKSTQKTMHSFFKTVKKTDRVERIEIIDDS